MPQYSDALAHDATVGTGSTRVAWCWMWDATAAAADDDGDDHSDANDCNCFAFGTCFLDLDIPAMGLHHPGSGWGLQLTDRRRCCSICRLPAAGAAASAFLMLRPARGDVLRCLSTFELGAFTGTPDSSHASCSAAGICHLLRGRGIGKGQP